MAMGTILPSIFLSGYVFPLDSMPGRSPAVALLLPDHLDDRRLARVILRGGGWPELWQHAVVLWGMATAALVGGSLQLQKRL